MVLEANVGLFAQGLCLRCSGPGGARVTRATEWAACVVRHSGGGMHCGGSHDNDWVKLKMTTHWPQLEVLPAVHHQKVTSTREPPHTGHAPPPSRRFEHGTYNKNTTLFAVLIIIKKKSTMRCIAEVFGL